MKKKLLPLAVLAAFTVEAATNTLTIIQTTDIHADPNFARIATHIASERSANRDILLIDCGDLTRGTFAATVDDGAAEVATLNALRYDVWIPGNHEFRAGQTHLRRVLEQFRSGDVLAANLSFNEAPAPRRKILPWKIYKRSGLRVAVIGLISPDRERWYGGILYRGMETRSAAEAIADVLPDVRAENPDVIIVAAHLGARSSSGDEAFPKLPDFIASQPDISLLLAGHTHQSIPLQAITNSCWIVQPPIHAEAAARVTLSYDTESRKVVSATGEFLYARDAEPWPKMPKEWTRRPERAKAAEAEVVAVLPENVALRPSKDPAIENPLPAFAARAMVEATGSDAALAEVGRRAALPVGAVTVGSLYRFASREDYLSVVTLSPEDLRKVIDEQKAKGCPLVPHGLDYEHLPDHPIRLTLGAYAADGSDGHYPVLREIANSAAAAREDTEISLRGCVEALLRRLYPVTARQ